MFHSYLAPKLFLVTKNAFLTIAATIAITPFVIEWPDLPVDVAFWGSFGGAVRWMATRSTPLQGILGIFIGMFMALGLNGATFPFLGDLMPAKEHSGHAIPFLIGAFGVVIYGVVQDIITLKFGEKRNNDRT